LNAIGGWAALLEEGDLSPEQERRAIGVILRCVAAQGRLIQDLTEGARNAEDGLHIRRERIDIATVVSNAVSAVEEMAKGKQIDIDVRVPQSSIEISGDLQRLEQVVCNLLVNALNFSSRHSGIEVDVERRGATVALHVRDHGIGIPREFLPHVFDRLWRGDHGRGGGLGLGLAIARHIVERHGGSITADSAGEGHGASFTVELPVDYPSTTQDSAQRTT
jgi:signal transduction histidine kinase